MRYYQSIRFLCTSGWVKQYTTVVKTEALYSLVFKRSAMISILALLIPFYVWKVSMK